MPPLAVSCPSCGALSLPAAEADAAQAMGKRLAAALAQRYRVEREIGEGGMAIVFLAHDLRHDRAVAVKVLRPELAAFLGADRFLREIHIAAQLNHPHVLPLHDSGEADGLLYYVMPYVEGESLRERLSRERRLPVPEAVRIACEVADGLAYAHKLGVVHRDVKPENILLSHTHAIVADFGIARAVAGAGGVTTTGSPLGTPLYMSPEQASGSPTIDLRSDVYSLACVVFEMLAGEMPFAADSAQAMMARHATEPVPSVRARRREVSVRLDAAIRRAMAKEPSARFATATEFRAALEEGGLRIKEVLAARLRSPARPRVRTLVVGGLLAAAVLVAWRLWPPASAPPPPKLPVRVAVAYFSAAPGELRGFADRVTEALADRLQPIPALEMTSSAAMSPLRGAPLEAIRGRFRVDRFVTGAVEGMGEGARVTVRLVHGATLQQLPSLVDTVTSLDNVDLLVDSLSRFVRESLAAEIELAEQHARVHSAAAWDLVQQAGEANEEATKAAEARLPHPAFVALDRADSLLRRARALDGRSTLIPVLIARTADRRAFVIEYLRQAAPDASQDLGDPRALRLRALAIVDSLLRKHPDAADAYALSGVIKAGLPRVGGGDSLLESAIADLERSRTLDPRRFDTWSRLASAYGSAGRHTDALFAYQRALDADVFQRGRRDEDLRGLYDAALNAGLFADAEAACRTGLRQYPRAWIFRDCELRLLSRTARTSRDGARALALADSLMPIEAIPLWRSLDALHASAALARTGRGAEADRLAARAMAPLPDQPLLMLELAWVRLQRGDTTGAIAQLADAIHREPSFRRGAVQRFSGLESDPRFSSAVSGVRP